MHRIYHILHFYRFTVQKHFRQVSFQRQQQQQQADQAETGSVDEESESEEPEEPETPRGHHSNMPSNGVHSNYPPPAEPALAGPSPFVYQPPSNQHGGIGQVAGSSYPPNDPAYPPQHVIYPPPPPQGKY